MNSAKSGNAGGFDGSDDYAAAPNTLNTSNSYTVMAWVQPDATGSYRSIISQDGANVSAFFLQSTTDNRFRMYLPASDSSAPATSALVTSNATYETGKWYHLAGVVDASAGKLRLYVNGELQGEATLGSRFNAAGNLVVGASKWAGSRSDFFDGRIDEVKAYSRALTAAEVAARAGGELSRAGWTITTSANSATAANAIDASLRTEWLSNTAMTNGMWFQIDRGASSATPFNRIVLDSGIKENDYPRTYSLYLSETGTDFGTLSPVKTGASSSNLVEIRLDAPSTARYVRVVNNTAVSNWWRVADVQLLGAAAAAAAPVQQGIFDTSADIGSPSPAGSASYANNVYTVAGGGADIWGASDQFRYHHKSLSGDFTIISRITSQTNTNAWAKAGLMIRASAAANAAHVSIVATPSSGTAMQYRSSTGAASASIGSNTSHKWVRLARVGANVTASVSSDRTTWSVVGTQSIGATGAVLVGLAVTSHANGTLSTATFENVAISASVTYQAENATLSGGVVDTVHAGYNGTGFYDFGVSGTSVTFDNVGTGTSGSHTLSFRYANGKSTSRTVDLIVNGTVYSLTFAPTGSWTTWSTVSVTLNLLAANNTIRLQSIGQDGGNLDEMTLRPA